MNNSVWINSEFKSIQFGDKRLSKRFISVMENLSRSPSTSVNGAFASWAETKAAYRLFDNDKFSVDEVLDKHRQGTLDRAKGEKYVLAIQDTTTLNYHDHKNKEGLGLILNKEVKGSDGTRGIFLHNTLLVTPKGLPIGLFDQEIFIRKKEKRSKAWSKSVEEKETFKWIRPTETIKAYFPENITPVIVADREADKFSIMAFSNLLQEKFLIRFCRNRVIGPRSGRNFKGEYYHDNDYIDSLVERSPVKGQITLEVRDKKTKKQKKIKADIKFDEFLMAAPKQTTYHDKNLPDFHCYFIQIKEVSKNEDSEKIEWRLFTNIKIESMSDAIEKIEWYKHRWKVEVFHKILKSGCKIEDRRFLNMDRLNRAIVVYSIIAWRLQWLTTMARENPNITCDKILSGPEWKILYIREKGKGKPLPKEPPKVQEAIVWMAKLGGYLNRKSDGPPGPLTIWTGWQQLRTMTDTFELLTYG